ncbi:UNVERIFIED_CONTAM: hypothetical protein HDU68_000699, partial [Siphonaria sp. JEL0065]
MAAIDYNLVYALHSFVATLEGQVCVLKGDPLALLDDTNSYWWLVRCCKTDEIGYIPAENVETPSERVARLNRIRNVQLALVTESDFGSTDDNANSGVVEISLAALEEAMNQPFDEDAMIFPRPNTAIKFTAEPQIFEEAFLGEDYDDLIDAEDADQTDNAVVVEEEFMDDAVSAGSGTEEDGKKDVVKDATGVGSVVDISPAIGDDDTAYKKPSNSPSQQQRSGSFWSRLRRNLSNPSIGVIPAAAFAVTEEKPQADRKQSINQGTPISGSNRSSDVKPIQTTKPAYGSSPSLPTTPPKSAAPETIRVLRIYSGNVDLSASATFKTVVWSQETTVQDLLAATLKRFKVQNAAPGEYYLSILHFDSQERRLPESENIYKILEQLSNKKLPGLSTSKTVTKILSNTNNDANNTQILINDDQIIKIIVNRNIHLVDDEQQNDARLLRVFM